MASNPTVGQLVSAGVIRTADVEAAVTAYLAAPDPGIVPLGGSHEVDITAAIAALMMALTEAGTSDHVFASIAAGVCAVSTVLFVLQERRARDPMMDFGLWARRPIATANAATLLSGMTVIGLTTFLPMYVQGVLNQSALVAGFTLTVMVLGWPIGATLAARNFSRFGLRATLLFGASLLPVGALAFLFMAPGVSPVVAGVGSAVMGFGMGFLSTSAIVIIQDCVEWGERGSATASNIFSRNLGSTLGATMLGAVLNISLAHRGDGAAVHFDQIRQLLDHSLTGAGDDVVQGAAPRGEQRHDEPDHARRQRHVKPQGEQPRLRQRGRPEVLVAPHRQAHQRLARRQRLEHFLAHRTHLDALDQRLHHRQRDVGFQQRDAHFARGLADVLFGQTTAAAQALHGAGQALGQGLEHAGLDTAEYGRRL